MAEWRDIVAACVDQQAVAGPEAGDIERAFFGHKGRIVDKWHHYLPAYDRYFAAFRAARAPVRLLEIGVFLGGSIELWRSYFGPSARIFGVDVDPNCAQFDGESGSIRIGSQDDAAFLTRVVGEMGGLDIVIDDGSHRAAHQRASFDVLYPLLADGGLYVVEDLHTSYWDEFEGGYDSPGSFISRIKTLIDDMHHWYHDRGQVEPAGRDSVAALHIHDSMVVIEKRPVSNPLHSKRGGSPAAMESTWSN